MFFGVSPERKVLVAPSLLAADPMQFANDVKSVEDAGADMHHVDVMDGHFVPNLTYGLPFVKALKQSSRIPLDVHIMVSNPDEVAALYADAGAAIVVFPIESARHPHRILQDLHQRGVSGGLAVNPGTPIQVVEPLLPFLDMINVMTVNPGFGGQAFIPEMLQKIVWLRDTLQTLGRSNSVAIQVDGGITAETGRLVVEAGARILVAGTYVYGSKDRSVPIKALHSLQRGIQ